MTPNSFETLVRVELARARAKYPEPMRTAEHAWQIIADEVQEFIDAANGISGFPVLDQLVQVAAMSQRAAEDLSLLPPDP